MPELTWDLVVSWPWDVASVSQRSSSGYSEFSGQTVAHSRDSIFSISRDLYFAIVVSSRSRHFILIFLSSASNSAEVSHAAVLILRVKVGSFFVDAKSYWIGAWPRDF